MAWLAIWGDWGRRRSLPISDFTRLVQSTATATQRVCDEIQDFAQSLEAVLRTDSAWHATSIIASLRGVGMELGPRAEWATRVAKEGSLREVVRIFEGPTGRWARIAGTLCRRLQRWSIEPGELLRIWPVFAETRPPAELACSIFRTACYSWWTTTYVARPAEACGFCGEVEADRQSHHAQHPGVDAGEAAIPSPRKRRSDDFLAHGRSRRSGESGDASCGCLRRRALSFDTIRLGSHVPRGSSWTPDSRNCGDATAEYAMLCLRRRTRGQLSKRRSCAAVGFAGPAGSTTPAVGKPQHFPPPSAAR